MNHRNRALLAHRLATPVGFRGTLRRQEVAGPVCLGVILGIVLYEG